MYKICAPGKILLAPRVCVRCRLRQITPHNERLHLPIFITFMPCQERIAAAMLTQKPPAAFVVSCGRDNQLVAVDDMARPRRVSH